MGTKDNNKRPLSRAKILDYLDTMDAGDGDRAPDIIKQLLGTIDNLRQQLSNRKTEVKALSRSCAIHKRALSDYGVRIGYLKARVVDLEGINSLLRTKLIQEKSKEKPDGY